MKRTNGMLTTRRTSNGALKSRTVFSLVMRYENPGQLTVPTHLFLGSDDKLYLAHDAVATNPQPISVKESVAWFRLAHDCHVCTAKEVAFSKWLGLVERELAVTTMLRSMTK